MDVDEAYALLGRAEFLDVRRDEEYAAGHVAGAVHISLQQIPLRYEELPGNRPVIVTCQVGQRSGLATEFLRARGIDAHNLEGGLELWLSQGLPLVTGDEEPGVVIDGRFEDLELGSDPEGRPASG
ncbi:MAG: rhodanese-like domain-containing protein [Actinomycetota bacterium]|nr:rhodanese-like domain-containing protein [Actinomycetota bacterium]